MAEEGQTATAGKAETPKDEVPTYHRDRLIAEAGVRFSQPPYVVEAALSMAKGNKVHFTVDETEKLIKQFLDHEVETDNNPEGEED